MKKIIPVILACVLCLSLAVPASAYNYEFSTGEETIPGFGKSTGNSDPVPPDPMSRNTRSNKDAAFLPPPYFYGSGDIPTDTGSPYHDNMLDGAVITSDSFVGAGAGTAISSGNNVAMSESTSVSMNLSDGMLAPTSTFSGTAYKTEAKYYEDGSIGTLQIEKLKKTLTVYEGESLENMRNGVGHFENTSVWDGNCGLAGHNRGASAYFAFVKDLVVGDKLTYTTLYGTRTYEVYSKTKVTETDYSGLGWTADNIISLITCVADEPEYRYLVQAKEVRN